MSAYIDTSAGETIKKPGAIALNYVKNGFLFDFLSTTPIFLKPLINAVTDPGSKQQTSLTSIVTAFRLMKLLRIRRLNVLITELDMDLLIKNQLKRAYVIFILIIICHIQGCMIYAIVRDLEIWIPPLDFGSISTNVFDDEKSFLDHYAKMFYHSTLLYSMVDISGRSTKELVIMSGLIIVSALINAIIYG